MPAIINPTITDAGLAAAVDADSNSLQVQITHVVIGAGGFTPTGSETALLDRREKVSVAAGSVAIGGALTVNVIFPAYAGASYDAREIGFYIGDPDAGGVLFAIYSDPAPLGFVSRSSLEFIAQFSLGLTRVPVGSVSVTIDPAAAVLFALIQEHEDKADPHPQYMTGAEVAAAISTGNAATAGLAGGVSVDLVCQGLAVGGGALTADRVVDVPKATPAQAIAGLADDVAMTPLSTKQAIDVLAKGLGVSQRWISVSRAGGTWYQNTSGAPIGVSIKWGTNGNALLRVGPSTGDYVTIDQNDGDSGEWKHLTTVVPRDHWYYAPNGNFLQFLELR